MPWWKRAPVVGRITAVAEAAALATKLVKEGASDADVLAQLRTVRGRPRALQDAAAVMERHADGGYPATRVHRLLREAADDPIPAPTEEQSAVEGLQRRLWELPAEESFRELAEQVPELRELERTVRSDPGSLLSGLTFRDTGRIGGPPPRADRQDGQALILITLQKEIRRVVGPRSGLSDPVLASEAAERAAWDYLREASGIDPRNWPSR